MLMPPDNATAQHPSVMPPGQPAVATAPAPRDPLAFEQALDLALVEHRLAVHRGNLPMVVGGTALLALVFWLLAGQHAPVWAGQLWLGLVLVVQASRIGLEWAHRRSQALRPVPRPARWWLGWHRALVLAHGLSWVSASLMPLGAAPPDAEVLRVIMLLVLVAGGFSLLAFDLPAALLFAVPVVGSLAIGLLFPTDSAHLMMAAGLVAALCYLALAARRAGATLSAHVRLKQVAQDQAQALREHQALLAEQSAVLATTLEATDQGIVYMDHAGRLRVFNQRAFALLDLPKELVPSGAHHQSVRAFQAARGDLPPEGYFDLHGQPHPVPPPDADGVTRYVRRTLDGRCLAVRIRNLPDGSQVRTYTDVTDAQQAQRALTQAKDQAERASQAKSQFLSGMSHELRTPLNAVQGFAELLRSDQEHPLHASHRQPVAEIGRAAQHLRRLIEDLLDLSVLESGRLQVQRTPVLLLPLVNSALALVQPLAQQARVLLPASSTVLHGQDAAWASAGPPQVWADATRLTQVLLNLLDNAIKYNRPGGGVRVHCEYLSAGAAGQPACWRISVEDDGPGLPPGHQALVFEPFERLAAARSAVPGVGLGLALSRRLLEAMQGQIGVHSAAGGGACFWLTLPVCPVTANAAADTGAEAPDSPMHQAVAGPPGPGADMGRLHDAVSSNPAPDVTLPTATLALAADAPVLYVEDNPVNAALMEAMFRRLGLQGLVVAATGAEGLQQLAALQPRLVLLDIELPDTNGYALLAQIRQDPRWQAVPVLAVTANALPDDVARGLRAGFAQYLTKPVSLARLQAALAEVLPGPVPQPPPPAD